ncbi:unnamed protein product, partial [marine sediment metagenome]
CLEHEIPSQVQRVNTRKKKMSKGKAKWQRDLEDIDRRVEEAKRKADRLRRSKHKANRVRRDYVFDPRLREISRKYQGLLEKSESASRLVCPKCEEGDRGNRMNKSPWCMKCNTALIPKDELEKCKNLPEIKFARNALKKELHRLNPGLDPDNKEEAT